jgi:hypothetical protein
MTYNSEEKIGIYSVAKIFTENIGWIFREQPVNDFGIDGFVEITSLGLNLKDLIPTGRLLGVQIKSGKSFFKETTPSHFVFRGSIKHLEYWLNHSIPVIVIIYDKKTNSAYWQEVQRSKILLLHKSFKINIPIKNLLNSENKEPLVNIGFFKTKYEYKLWQLRTSIEKIRLVIERELFLYVEISSIPNSEDYYIILLISDENRENCFEIINDYGDENPNRFEYQFCLSKGKSLKEGINDTLPWADLFINKEYFFDEMLTEQISNEILGLQQEDFIQDVLELKGKNLFLSLACYVADSYCFRLELKANDLAYNFLAIDKFLSKEPVVKQMLFI